MAFDITNSVLHLAFDVSLTSDGLGFPALEHSANLPMCLNKIIQFCVQLVFVMAVVVYALLLWLPGFCSSQE